jgi:beta-hydroxylase
MSRAHYDPRHFPFVAEFESHWEQIRHEYLGIRDRLTAWHEQKLYDAGWDVFALFDFPGGAPIEAAIELCPFTSRLIETAIPRHGVGGFSVLAPGTKVRPHMGYQGNFLRMHLALEVPEGDCALCVAGETRRWTTGKVLVFDDRLEHSAWNLTAARRVVLLVDFMVDDEFNLE